jgi:metallo-beta-lactamase family protein
MTTISFFGGAETVTGSRFLVESAGQRLLLDCGLFQGLKTLRLRNREPFPVRPSDIGAVVLTHAHIDHSGYVPVLVRDGFSGPVWATEVTEALCGVLLPDSGKLQEEEAAAANRHGYSRHRPALPLYTAEDANRSLERITSWDFDRPFTPLPGLEACFRHAGHIPGAAMVHLRTDDASILFSGDVGRATDPLLPPPADPPAADVVVMESTYGNRSHPPGDPGERLAEIIRRTVARGGAVVVPSFAVGRAQLLLYHLDRLLQTGAIPKVPVFLDSPMATRATRILFGNAGAHTLTKRDAQRVAEVAEVAASVQDSKRVTAMRIPRIIVSASGMATGGRVLHHLKALLPDPRNTVLLGGFQAAGTRGAHLRDGADRIKIHGGYVDVRAEVATLDGLSAHADADELLRWLARIPEPPREVILTHGEPEAADTLRVRVEEELGFACRVARHLERVDLRSQ